MPGPLVARWLTWMLDEPRAGALGGARVEIENAGTATWHGDVSCSYHWLDGLGNPIVWDGIRTPLPREVAPDERVPDGWELAPGSAVLALQAHAEGYAVVAPSIEAPRSLRRALEPWSEREGRDPGFEQPLLCPSVLHGITLERLADVEGLPAFAPPPDEPWIYDGRVVVRSTR